MTEDPHTLDWGECSNSRSALIYVNYWDVHTRDIFGCVEFEARAAVVTDARVVYEREVGMDYVVERWPKRDETK